MNRFTIVTLLLFIGLAFKGCGDTKQNQSNLSNISDEAIQFSKSLYGESASILAKGDLLNDGKICAIAGIVKLKTDNSYWVEKASLIQKDKESWKVLLNMDKRLSSGGNELITQVDANNGYIISFDTSSLPLTINIVMANEYGKASSDEALLKWNKDKEVFEFIAPYDENIP
jgi:hypothetical protein